MHRAVALAVLSTTQDACLQQAHAPYADCLARTRRRFVTCVLGHLVRLSYWERVRSTIPESFLPLLPPKPEVQPVQPVQPVPAKAEDGGVGRDGGDGEADGGGAAAESGGESAEADKEQEVPAAESDEVVYVKKVVELVRGVDDATASIQLPQCRCRQHMRFDVIQVASYANLSEHVPRKDIGMILLAYAMHQHASFKARTTHAPR